VIKESDLTVGQRILDSWYFPGESGEIMSIKGRMIMVKFGSLKKVYDVDEAKKLLTVKRY
jgi:hypothetical protein